MAVDPTNNFLYGISEGAGQVFGFKINTSAGTLAALNPANLPSQGSQPVSMALHPSVNNTGQFLFVSNASGNIASFTLNTTSGGISNPLSVAAPAAPSGLAVH
jgi:6-phosphogluconolactonase (cycloisomerase 2 family)